jgi:hypothetical protein
MPTVPEIAHFYESQSQKDRPTPEHLLMTAADMHGRGQLIDGPSFSKPGASLKLPFVGGGRGPRFTGSKGKRR